jgi:hypothetical protein
MTLYSPDKRNPLVALEGSHSDIWTRGDQLVTLGETMEQTATSLKKISDGETQISEAIDTLRESAGEVHSDLTKAATRYAETGKVLRTYATALNTGQSSMTPLVEQIEQKSIALDSARTSETTANTNSVIAPEGEKDAKETALNEATAARKAIEGDLDELWESYDRHFGTWEDAYDDAVNGVEGAMKAADNNDSWFDDALDMFIEILGWVIVALVIVALFVAAPLAAIIMAVVAVLTVISLLGHIYLYVKGRATLTDIALDIVGLIPFVKPGIAALRGGGSLLGAGSRFTALLNSGAAESAIGIARSKLTHFMMHGVRGPAAQAAMRETIANLLKPGAGPLRTAWSRILGGNATTGELLILNNHIRTTVLGEAPRMTSWLRNPVVQGALPGGVSQGVNLGNFVIGLDQVGQVVVPPYGDFRDKY